MSAEPILASRRRIAIGLFIALQASMHIAAPCTLALSDGAGGGQWLVYFAFAVLGICSGQSSLGAVWLGLRPGGAFKRAPTTLLAWAFSILRLVAIASYHNAGLHITIYVLTFSQFLLLIVPLVVVRLTTGKRLVDSLDRHEPESPFQFSLRHIFFWMAGCAAFVALHRLLLLPPETRFPDSFGSVLIDSYRLVGYPMCMSPFLMLPILWAVAARRFVVPQLVVATMLLPVLTYLESLHPYCDVQGVNFFDFEILMWLNGSHAAWLTANLVLLRLAGYRLERSLDSAATLRSDGF